MNLQHDKEIAYTPPCQEQRYIGHGPKKKKMKQTWATLILCIYSLGFSLSLTQVEADNKNGHNLFTQWIKMGA